MLLLKSLQNPKLYPHPVTEFRLIETHISWILLTGDYAYKIKKSVDFGFLDFSSLKKRHFYCQEEFRLNSRLAPDYYLGVVSICGNQHQPILNQGRAFEYAIKMRQFNNESLFSKIQLEHKHIDSLALELSKFHQSIPKANLSKPYGLAKSIQQAALHNFSTISPLATSNSQQSQLQVLQTWTKQQYKHLKGLMWRRRQQGFVRECHGDLHLGNIFWNEDKAILFDCIEFNPFLRWIDVINDLAFTVMDLQHKQQPALAYQLLNQYLNYTGDYVGLRLLTYYCVYRAMVRAKVSLLTGQSKIQQQLYQSYIDLALSFTQKQPPCLIVMRGLSGSGKSYLASQLIPEFGAIHINSDIVRKRLAGFSPLTRTKSDLGSGIYTPKMSHKTYQNLKKQAEISLKAGFSVIVDATFLRQDSFQEHQMLADSLDIPFLMIDVQADINDLRKRVETRFKKGNDASEADLNVLEKQLENYQALKENNKVLVVYNNQQLDMIAFKKRVKSHLYLKTYKS